jgi:hypothetical protein
MQREPPTSQGHHRLKLLLGGVIGFVGALLMFYLWYGPEHFFSELLMSMFGLLGGFMFLRFFKPKTSQPLAGNEPD